MRNIVLRRVHFLLRILPNERYVVIGLPRIKFASSARAPATWVNMPVLSGDPFCVARFLQQWVAHARQRAVSVTEEDCTLTIKRIWSS